MSPTTKGDVNLRDNNPRGLVKVILYGKTDLKFILNTQ